MVTITPSERFTPYSPVVPTTVFAVGFPILDNADVVLMHNGSVVTGAVVSGTYADGVSTNAVITAPAGLIGAVQVVGVRLPQRTSQYLPGRPLPISDHNYALNRIEMEIQESRRETNRSMKLPVGDKPVDFPAKTVRAGKYLSFDTGGNPVAVTDVHEVATVAAIASEIVTVANISGAVVAVKDNATNINKVAAIDTAVSAVGVVADDIPTVVDMRPDIEAVIADKANIGTVAAHIANVDTVAGHIASVDKVAAVDTAVVKVAAIDANVTTVAGIAPAVSAVAADHLVIAAVNANKSNIDAVNANKAHIDTVAGISGNVSTVASIAAQVTVTAGIEDEIIAVAGNATRINAVAANELNINATAGNATNINAVAGNATNINAVVANSADISTVADNSADIDAVAANIAKVSTVSTNIADVVIAADNMPAIIAAPAKADAAAQSADDAATSATSAVDAKDEALSVYANLAGGTNGQVLVKFGSNPFDFAWQDLGGGGDMLKSVFDPQGKNADAFNMLYMVEGANALILRDAERTRIAASTSNTGTVTSVAVAVPAGFSVSGAITTSGTITISHASGYQGYTTAEANKLSGIDLSLYQTRSQKDAANGYAGLDGSGKLSAAQLPSIAITDTFVVATQAAMLALTVQVGDIAVRTDVNKTFIVQAEPATTLANWVELRTPTDAVQSVIGLTGPITQTELRTALGLGTAAYAATGDFATAASGLLANTAVQPAALALKVSISGSNDLTGFMGVIHAIGNITAGATIKPVLGNGNYQALGHSGSFTLQAPDGVSNRAYDMSIFVTSTVAGSLTATGFNLVTGTFKSALPYHKLTICRRDSSWVELIIESKAS